MFSYFDALLIFIICSLSNFQDLAWNMNTAFYQICFLKLDVPIMSKMNIASLIPRCPVTEKQALIQFLVVSFAGNSHKNNILLLFITSALTKSPAIS